MLKHKCDTPAHLVNAIDEGDDGKDSFRPRFAINCNEDTSTMSASFAQGLGCTFATSETCSTELYIAPNSRQVAWRWENTSGLFASGIAVTSTLSCDMLIGRIDAQKMLEANEFSLLRILKYFQANADTE